MSAIERRDLVALALVALPLAAARAGVAGPSAVHLRLGPADGPYISGFAPEYEIVDGRAAQWSGPDAGVDLPIEVSGPLILSYRYARPLDSAAEAQVAFAGATADRFAPRKSSEERQVALHARPDTPLRLRFQVEGGEPGRGLRLEWVHVEAGPMGRVRLRGLAAARPALLVACLYLALRIAAWGPLGAALWTLPLSLAATLQLLRDPWLVDRLATGLPEWLFVGGVGGALVARWLHARGALDAESLRFVTALAATAFLFRAALFNHPDYYYPDLRIHAKLSELVRAAGFDFLRAPADYIVRHKSWSRIVDGQVFAFPYTPAFHALFAPTGLSYDGLIHALKLGSCLATVVPIATLWSLCRRWGASTFGVVLLLLVPIYVHHLGLAYLAALFGHAVDMVFVAWIARGVDHILTPRTFAASAALVAACQLAYVSAVIVLPVFLGVLAACVVAEENGRGVRRATAILAAGAAGSLLAVLLYYRNFWPLLAHAMSHASSGLPVAASDDAAKEAFFSVLWRFTRRFFDYAWTPAAVVGLVIIVRRGTGRSVVLAWSISYLVLLFGRAHLPFVFQHPHDALFVAPLVCLGAGESLAALGRGPGPRKLLAAALFATLAIQGLFVQWQAWARHLHPEL